MSPDKKENKRIKRKAEESAEESANKYLRPVDGTSSGTKQVEQAEEKVRESISRICCIPNERYAHPQCTVCPKSFPINIKSSPFKDHYKKEHLEIDTEKNESEWIFRHFDLVENKQHLKCKICEGTVEVLEFEGQFIDHFKEDKFHKEIVDVILRDSDKEGTEKVKEKRTIDIVRHLYEEFKKKDAIEDNENKKKCEKSEKSTSSEKQDEQAEGNVRGSSWMVCCVTNDTGADPECLVCGERYSFYIESSPFKDHCKEEHPEIDTEKNKSEWIFRHFDLVENKQHLKCKICEGTVEVLEFEGQFIDHFKDERHQKYAEENFEKDKNKYTKEFIIHKRKTFVLHLYKAYEKNYKKSKEGTCSEKQPKQGTSSENQPKQGTSSDKQPKQGTSSENQPKRGRESSQENNDDPTNNDINEHIETLIRYLMKSYVPNK